MVRLPLGVRVPTSGAFCVRKPSARTASPQFTSSCSVRFMTCAEAGLQCSAEFVADGDAQANKALSVCRASKHGDAVLSETESAIIPCEMISRPYHATDRS